MKPFLLSAVLLLWMLASVFAGSATWNLSPPSSDWNTATNWTPATVPNGPTDIATFGVSNTTELFFSANPVEVSSIVFNSGASSYNITLDPEAAQSAVTLTISGAGIINNSGLTQSLTAVPTNASGQGVLKFLNAASAGDDTVLTISGSAKGVANGALLYFYDTASAGSARIFVGGSVAGFLPYGAYAYFYGTATAENASLTVGGSEVSTGEGGRLSFNDSSTAGAADIVVESSNVRSSPNGGELDFTGNATAANATISVQAATSSSSTGDPAYMYFYNTSSAGSAVITAEGGTANGAFAGSISFYDETTAGNATLIANGGTTQGAHGADISGQEDTATAGAATLIANGGTNGGAGGEIGFSKCGKATFIANGGTNGGAGGGIFFTNASKAKAVVFGNGYLDISYLGPSTVGSLEGNGLVFLGSKQLTVGTINVSTEFSGAIQDTGSLTKSGTATFTLSGANTYTGGTVVEAGTLIVKTGKGSATGPGPVQVNGGTFGGRSNIAGAVTIGSGSGTGAFLAPGINGPGVLTIKNSLTFQADGAYQCDLSLKQSKADKVSCRSVSVAAGAQFILQPKGSQTLANGTVFTVINNTGGSSINGTFANLADGDTITAGPNTLQANYKGGDGNDLTLTVVP